VILYKNQSTDLKSGGMPMASSLQFSNDLTTNSSPKEVQIKKPEPGESSKFEHWPDH